MKQWAPGTDDSRYRPVGHTTLVVDGALVCDVLAGVKAGILEFADIFSDKADRPGVENTERALKGMLNLAHPVPGVPTSWTVDGNAARSRAR